MKISFSDAALAYAEMGWSVFPLAAGTKIPAIPIDKSKPPNTQGVHLATRDPEQIKIWDRKYPKSNIGLACGQASDVMVLDVDPRNGGGDTLAQMANKGRVLTPTPRARTGNGGWHYFYRYQAGLKNSKSKLGKGIDIKTTGGYVVIAPSEIAPSKDGPGGAYSWEVSPREAQIARLPVWITAALTPSPTRPQAPAGLEQMPPGPGGGLDSLISFVARSPHGQRNNCLMWAACRGGELILSRKASESETVARLYQAGRASGLDDAETKKTIMSAFRTVGVR